MIGRMDAGVVWGTASLVLVFALAAACGGDEDATSQVGRTEQEEPTYVSAVTVTAPPPVVESEPVGEEATDEPEGEIRETPEEVSYEDAESVFGEKRYDEAVELFSVYAEHHPQNPWGFYMLGLSAWKAGWHERAEEAFNRTLELDPEHRKGRLNLSRVYLETGRSEEALGLVESVLESEPESNAALRLRGRAYHELGRLDEAVESYQDAILVDDQDTWSMNNLGLILIEQERFQEALAPLARAVEIREDVAIFQNNLGMALERTGHFRAAEEAYRLALSIDGAREKSYVNLARVEMLEEDPQREPVNLTDLAQSFVDEVQGWRESVAQMLRPEVIDSTIVVTESDSLDVGEGTSGTDERGEPGDEQG